MMDTSVVAAALAALAAITSAAFTWRSSMKATDTGERIALHQIEAGAYERARQSYEGALARMQAEIDRQGNQIHGLQRQVARLTRQVTQAGLVPAISVEEDT